MTTLGLGSRAPPLLLQMSSMFLDPHVDGPGRLLVLLALLPAPRLASGHVHLLGHLVSVGFLEVGAPLLHLLLVDGSHGAGVVLWLEADRFLESEAQHQTDADR